MNDCNLCKWQIDCGGITKLGWDTRCVIDGDTTEIGIIGTCRVHSDRLTSHQIKTFNDGKRGSQRHQRCSHDSLISIVSRLSDGLFDQTGSSTRKRMLIANGADSPTLREQPSGPFDLINDEGDVNTFYKSSESNEWKLQNHKNVIKNDKEWQRHDQRGHWNASLLQTTTTGRARSRIEHSLQPPIATKGWYESDSCSCGRTINFQTVLQFSLCSAATYETQKMVQRLLILSEIDYRSVHCYKLSQKKVHLKIDHFIDSDRKL